LLAGHVYDADPFDNFAFWSDPAWSGIHFVSMATAAELILEPPED